jgi:hypothetical protein
VSTEESEPGWPHPGLTHQRAAHRLGDRDGDLVRIRAAVGVRDRERDRVHADR